MEKKHSNSNKIHWIKFKSLHFSASKEIFFIVIIFTKLLFFDLNFYRAICAINTLLACLKGCVIRHIVSD